MGLVPGRRDPAAALVAGVVVALVAVATAWASQITPHSRVNGMLIVQGTHKQAEADLFGTFCDPVRLKPGRITRTCRPAIPDTTKLFIGYGLFALPDAVEQEWRNVTWDMWLDGRHVDLSAFGFNDRTLFDYPPADGRDVTLREWSVLLLQATPRSHTVRWRARGPTGTTDTTWKFRITPG